MSVPYETYRDHEHCQRVFQSVILQAIRDALITRVQMTGSERINKREARQWLKGETDDFREVCLCAGFEPTKVAAWWMAIKDRADDISSIRDGLLVEMAHRGHYNPRSASKCREAAIAAQ